MILRVYDFVKECKILPEFVKFMRNLILWPTESPTAAENNCFQHLKMFLGIGGFEKIFSGKQLLDAIDFY